MLQCTYLSHSITVVSRLYSAAIGVESPISINFQRNQIAGEGKTSTFLLNQVLSFHFKTNAEQSKRGSLAKFYKIKN